MEEEKPEMHLGDSFGVDLATVGTVPTSSIQLEAVQAVIPRTGH